MLDEILDDEKFSAIMKRHIFECIEYLLKNDRSFSAMANLDLVKFDPHDFVDTIVDEIYA